MPVKVVTDEGTLVAVKPFGSASDKDKFKDAEQAQKDADRRNEEAEKLGIKTRYKVEED